MCPGLGPTLLNTLSCSEEDAISVVFVKMKPLMMPNTSMDTMLATYTHWYMCCPTSSSIPPISQKVWLPCGPQVIFGVRQDKSQELVKCEEKGTFQRELERGTQLMRVSLAGNNVSHCLRSL